jgi:hypothetical protein
MAAFTSGDIAGAALHLPEVLATFDRRATALVDQHRHVLGEELGA